MVMIIFCQFHRNSFIILAKTDRHTYERALTVALDLPDGVAHAPERRHGKEDGREVAVGDPDEKEDGETELQDSSDSHERLGGHAASDDTDDDREQEIGDAERDHVVTDILHPQSTRHVRLCTSIQRHMQHDYHSNYLTHRSPAKLCFPSNVLCLFDCLFLC